MFFLFFFFLLFLLPCSCFLFSFLFLFCSFLISIIAQEIDETLSGVNGTPLQVASPSVKEFLQSYIEWKNNNNNNNEKNDSTTSFSQLQQRIQKNALHKACLQGDIKVVRRLLKRRVGINQGICFLETRIQE